MTYDDFHRAVEAGFEHEPVEADREALRLVRSWHQHPEIAQALTCQGVNLGEMVELLLLRDVVPIMMDHFDAPKAR